MIKNTRRGPRNNNNGLGKLENYKHSASEGEQHTVRNRLEEDIYIT
jgi:hypothetical protein